MRVAEISFAGILSYAAGAEIGFKRTGVTVITGPNGSGKSSVLEAVSVCLWNEPLRGKSIWRKGDGLIEAAVTIGGKSYNVARSRRGSRTGMSWNEIGPKGPIAYETPTKAQEALEKVIGKHSLWRRSCVFSSHDADNFTTSTDAERKRDLEELIGLDRFDAAYDAAMQDRRSASSTLEFAKLNLAGAQREVEHTQERLHDAREQLANMPPPKKAVDHAVEVAALKLEIEAVEQAQESNSETCAKHRVKESSVSSTIVVLSNDAQRFASGKCPTCDAPVKGTSATLNRRVLELKAELAELNKARPKSLDRELSARRDRLVEKRAALVASSKEAPKLEAMRKATQAKIEELRALVEDAKDTLDEKTDLHAKAVIDHAEVSAACEVLGFKGVRGQLLAGALKGIEGIANAWLSRLGMPGLGVHLTTYTDTARGSREAIAVEIEGAGGGHGYKAASGGERRRIDVALMLALGEVAELAAGTTGGTLFFDEVFDALDSDGLEAVASVLLELAQNRPVVVITHSDELATRLGGTRIRVAAGQLFVDK